MQDGKITYEYVSFASLTGSLRQVPSHSETAGALHKHKIHLPPQRNKKIKKNLERALQTVMGHRASKIVAIGGDIAQAGRVSNVKS